MNKTLKILIILAFISTFFALTYILTIPETKNINSNIFLIKDTSEIYKIIIKKDTSEVTLTKKNNKWIVDNKYPANKKAVKKMYQMLYYTKIDKPVIKEKQDSIKKLIEKKGKIIKIFNKKNKLLKKITVGKYDKKNKGTYMMNPENNIPFIVNIPGYENDLNYRWNSNPGYWLKPEIFSYKPGEIKTIKIEYPANPEKSFKLKILEDTAFIFNNKNEQIKNINLKKTGSYLSYFMNVKFNSETKETEKLLKNLLKKQEYAEITLTDKYNITKNIKLYKIFNPKTNSYDLNNLYAVINDEDAVTVKYINFDLILKDINYFKN